ncbi:FecR family protein [Ferruginibacter sp.]|uniref:FecR family protein n=1 Tax=Ferruginibacter sp. TaxID=1940288 RepID=UPI002659C9A6|nr:FecR domain-containing protein [Ferruginibacter sp.]
MAIPSTRIEQLIALHFSGNIAPDQQLELAQLAAGLTNEQMQLLLEKAWADYIPDAAMPDAVSDKILAALFNDDTQPLSKDTFNIIQPVQQVQLEEERNDWLTPVSNQPAVDSTAVEINDKGAKNKKNVLSILLVLTASVAAAALVFIVNNNSGEINNQKKEVWKTFISTYGERKNFQLPDGSVVTLNGGSKVTIGGGYGVSTRDIFLEGEAFFDVKHNKEIPFIVHTSAMDIKAVGTAFDVKAYPGEKNTETALINGVVEVTLKEAQQRKVILQPNQKVQWTSPASGPVDAENEKSKAEDRKQKIAGSVQNITKTDDGDIIETAWKENKLVFTDESLSDIAVLLERWYGVKIVFADDAIRNYRFTGIFEKEELGSVLSILKESRSFNYVTVPGETIKVKLYK